MNPKKVVIVNVTLKFEKDIIRNTFFLTNQQLKGAEGAIFHLKIISPVGCRDHNSWVYL